jgi:hypothetical protein
LAAARRDTEAAVRYSHRVLERDPYDEHAHMTLVSSLREGRRHGEARGRYTVDRSRERCWFGADLLHLRA